MSLMSNGSPMRRNRHKRIRSNSFGRSASPASSDRSDGGYQADYRDPNRPDPREYAPLSPPRRVLSQAMESVPSPRSVQRSVRSGSIRTARTVRSPPPNPAGPSPSVPTSAAHTAHSRASTFRSAVQYSPPASPTGSIRTIPREASLPLTEATERPTILSSCNHYQNGHRTSEVLVAANGSRAESPARTEPYQPYHPSRPLSQASLLSQQQHEPEEPSPPAFDVPPVFLDPTADVLLKSSDNVFFRVHRIVLMLGSTHFKRALLDPPVSDKHVTPVNWDEPASTVSALLYRLYPIAKPEIDDLDHLIALAIAAHKCGMEGVLIELEAILVKSKFLDARPLAVYNVACRLDLTDVKRQAARRLVELHDPLDHVLRPDAVGLSALDFIALCDLRKKRIAYCMDAFDNRFPPVCVHLQGLSYGPWYEIVRSRLARNPSASVLVSLLDLSDAFEERVFGCGDEECSSSFSWSQVSLLKEELTDPNRFIGNEPYL